MADENLRFSSPLRSKLLKNEDEYEKKRFYLTDLETEDGSADFIILRTLCSAACRTNISWNVFRWCF